MFYLGHFNSRFGWASTRHFWPASCVQDIEDLGKPRHWESGGDKTVRVVRCKLLISVVSPSTIAQTSLVRRSLCTSKRPSVRATNPATESYETLESKTCLVAETGKTPPPTSFSPIKKRVCLKMVDTPKMVMTTRKRNSSKLEAQKVVGVPLGFLFPSFQQSWKWTIGLKTKPILKRPPAQGTRLTSEAQALVEA